MNVQQRMTQYWNCIVEQNGEELKGFFHENAYIRWHCTNEQFTVPEFIRANCEYPGDWNGKVERIEQIGNTIITAAHVWSVEMSCHVVSFFEMENGKIKALDEYWGDDGEMPQWRMDKHIGSRIHESCYK